MSLWGLLFDSYVHAFVAGSSLIVTKWAFQPSSFALKLSHSNYHVPLVSLLLLRKVITLLCARYDNYLAR